MRCFSFRLHAFLVDKGPWSSLDRGAPFVTVDELVRR